MLKELHVEAAKIGLHMNNTKTQFMTNIPDADQTITFHGKIINKSQSYIYLGQSVTLSK